MADPRRAPPSTQHPAPNTQPAVGFLTDTTLCIGCKACEVACKQWNDLPADGIALSGASYDNTLALGATTWRHVAFVEQFASYPGMVPSLTAPGSWLLMSDVCKHCQQAGCMDACPTGAIQFGPLAELKERASRRVAELRERGVAEAYHYGGEETAGGLNASFIL